MSGLFHLGDTEPSPTPTDLVLNNEQLLQAITFAKMAVDRLKGYSTHTIWALQFEFYRNGFGYLFAFSIHSQARECYSEFANSRLEQ